MSRSPSLNPSIPQPLDPMNDLDLSDVGEEPANQDIYREQLLEHYRQPDYAGRPAKFDWSWRDLNASCGDSCEVFVRMDGEKVAEARFEGHGCAVSIAAADLLMGAAVGQEAATLSAWQFADITRLLGVPIGPARQKCASLALQSLQGGLAARKK